MLSPTFRDLTRAECQAMLMRQHVGRLAFSFHDRVDIEPIGYSFIDDGLVFRTSPGSKIETLAHHPWVALEVDEFEDMFDWRSVVVHGTVYELKPTGNDAERHAYDKAVYALRQFLPETLREDDPVPFRSIVLRLELDQMTGRAARHGTGAARRDFAYASAP